VALDAIGHWIELALVVNMARDMTSSALVPLVVFAAYATGGLIAFPITVLVIMTAIVFGPLAGGVYAFGGALVHAAAAYWLGRLLGRHTVRRVAGFQLNRITRRLARKGIGAVAVIRLLPVASFWKVNIVAGASYTRWREFVIGTAIGVMPAIALTVTFVDRAAAAINDPGAGTFAQLAAVTAILIAGATYIWRPFGRPPAGSGGQSSS